MLNEIGPAGGRCAGDDQNLEIGPVQVRTLKYRMYYTCRHIAVALLMILPIVCILTVGAGQHGAGDPARERYRARIILGNGLAQCPQQSEPG